jgi:hypothetical protein
MPGFFLMPDRENGDVLRVEVIKSDVATAAEVDQPFPKRRVHISRGIRRYRGRLRIVARFQLRQPGIGLFCRQVQAGVLIVVPGT